MATRPVDIIQHLTKPGEKILWERWQQLEVHDKAFVFAHVFGSFTVSDLATWGVFSQYVENALTCIEPKEENK